MIIHSLFFEISVYNNWNFYLWVDRNYNNSRLIYRLIEILFFFNLGNVVVITFGSILFLVRRQKIFLSIFCIIASLIFMYYAIQTMSEL